MSARKKWTATVIGFPLKLASGGEPTATDGQLAEIASILPPPTAVVDDFYFLPKGMGPRQHTKVFTQILQSPDPDRKAYLTAMDRAHDARKELELAVGEQHRVLFAVMWRHYPDMARRILADQPKPQPPKRRKAGRSKAG